jgi:hypothetical protein
MREPKIAIDRILEVPRKVPVTDASSYALQQTNVLAKAYEQCRMNIATNRDKAAKEYVKQRGKNVPIKIESGDLVLRRSPKAMIATRNWKLNRAHGPYRVTELKDVYAELSTLDGTPVENPVHIRNLCPLCEKAILPWLLNDTREIARKIPPPASTYSDENGEMECNTDGKSEDQTNE